LLFISFAFQYNLKGQTVIDSLVTFNNETENFTIAYPSAWDTTVFASVKAKLKLTFAALIRPNFNNNGSGGSFSIKTGEFDSLVTLEMTSNEEKSVFSKKYADGEILESRILISKKKLKYNLLICAATLNGVRSIIENVNFIKANVIYTIGLTCPMTAYKRIQPSFEQVLDTFE